MLIINKFEKKFYTSDVERDVVQEFLFHDNLDAAIEATIDISRQWNARHPETTIMKYKILSAVNLDQLYLLDEGTSLSKYGRSLADVRHDEQLLKQIKEDGFDGFWQEDDGKHGHPLYRIFSLHKLSPLTKL